MWRWVHLNVKNKQTKTTPISWSDLPGFYTGIKSISCNLLFYPCEQDQICFLFGIAAILMYCVKASGSLALPYIVGWLERPSKNSLLWLQGARQYGNCYIFQANLLENTSSIPLSVNCVNDMNWPMKMRNNKQTPFEYESNTLDAILLRLCSRRLKPFLRVKSTFPSTMTFNVSRPATHLWYPTCNLRLSRVKGCSQARLS